MYSIANALSWSTIYDTNFDSGGKSRVNEGATRLIPLQTPHSAKSASMNSKTNRGFLEKSVKLWAELLSAHMERACTAAKESQSSA
jgi:hypothetical protein